MLKKLLITLVTSAVVLFPLSARASDLGSRQDDFIDMMKRVFTNSTKNDFTDDPTALEMITTSKSVRQLSIKYAVDYCLAKNQGETRKEDLTQLRYIESSMKLNNTPELIGAFRSLYITASVLAKKDICP